MKSLTLFLTFIVSSIFCASITAQLVDKYETETIYLQGRKYVKNGQLYPVGPGLKGLKEELKVSPEAVILFKEYQKQLNTARIISLISLGAIIAGIYTENEGWQIGLMAGGVVTSFAAFPFSKKASRNFQKSIWVRNRDVLK